MYIHIYNWLEYSQSVRIAIKLKKKQLYPFICTANRSLFTVLTPTTAMIADFSHYSASDTNLIAAATPLFLCRVFLGLGEGIAFPACHAIISKQIRSEWQSPAVAYVSASSYLGIAAAFGSDIYIYIYIAKSLLNYFPFKKRPISFGID